MKTLGNIIDYIIIAAIGVWSVYFLYKGLLAIINLF